MGVSSGVGPVSGYTHFGGTARRSAGTPRQGRPRPTKASIAARERELKAADREADIDRVVALETALTSVHRESFPAAERLVLPPPKEVDPADIRVELEETAGIPGLVEATGGGEVPPVAPSPDPVDRYELMRGHRKHARAGLPIFDVRARIEAARAADREAKAEASAEAERRADARLVEQARLDQLWSDLGRARSIVAEQLERNVAAETERRAAERAALQAEADRDWALLNANDPDATLAALERAFADNEAPAAAIDCEGDRTTVVMQFVSPEAIIPEKRPGRTPTGKPNLKKRKKTELNALYLQALGSNVLATVKETFAVAPGTEVVQLMVVRREGEGKHAGALAAIYLAEFGRTGFGAMSNSRDPGSGLARATEAVLTLKGKTETVSPIDLSGRSGVTAVLSEIERGL